MERFYCSVLLVIVLIDLAVRTNASPLLSTSSISQKLIGGSRNSKNEDPCAKVECEKPSSQSNCTVVKKDDRSVPRPSGKKAECCPLWKCTEDKKPGFFTFHGIVGEGNEKVQYTASRVADGGSPIHDMVSSVATGTHDATAIATSDGQPLSDDPMKDVALAFKTFGITI